MTSSDDTRKKLAAYAHEAWSGWMKYLFSKAEIIHESSGGDTAHLNEDLVERWQRQMNTKYEDLPESEKKSDLEEADKMLSIFEGRSCAPDALPCLHTAGCSRIANCACEHCIAETTCANCGKRPTEGTHMIHEDSDMEGKEVPLCDACGSFEKPTCSEIWENIAKKKRNKACTCLWSPMEGRIMCDYCSRKKEDRCPAVQRMGPDSVYCSLPAGHDGAHKAEREWNDD
jgi:hypothetical protein